MSWLGSAIAADAKIKAAWVELKILNEKSWLDSSTAAENGAQKLEQSNHEVHQKLSDLAHRIDKTNIIKRGAKHIFSLSLTKIHMKYGGHHHLYLI
jgi:hypothetical protein